MTHFYLTLPSNSSMEFFPDNTLTEFTTKLSSTIELTNEWEVGLAEIMFPRNWYTIPKEGFLIDVDHRGCDIRWLHELDTRHNAGEDVTTVVDTYNVKIKVKGGYYNSMDEFTDELNHAASLAFMNIDVAHTPPVFRYVDITRRIHVTVQPGTRIEFPPMLESILGLTFDQNPMCNKTSEKITIKGEHSCDLQTGIHALYIYCDLLQFTHVGDIKAPLLRVVDSGEEAGDVVTRYYEKPRYVPVQKKSFDTIEIVIRDDLGERILFEKGKVLLTLHFRRARNQYLI
jgi:hypothetical protein